MSSLKSTSTSPRTEFPTHGLLPRADTQAADFVRKHPKYDGRGAVVAILDTGIDPAAKGLQVTSDGKRKVVDFIDCTGSGDVLLGPPQKCSDEKPLELTGVSGRILRLNPSWTNPSGEWRIGSKWFYDIAPGDVKSRVRTERESLFKKNSQHLADYVSSQKQAAKKAAGGDDEADKSSEFEAQVDVLNTLSTSYSDQGPLLDCVVFHDGEQWRAAVDIDETGDLSEAKAMGAYKLTGDVALLSKRHLLYYTLNFYDNGDVLSIVTSVGGHSTHVAGIVAANHPEEPQNNGVAPGAQLLSLMIGDHRVGSMETGVGLTRAAIAIIEHGADLANMSFGEPSSTPNLGQWVQLVRQEVIRRHRCIFVSSAGNEGPALSTVGAPGGSTDSIIGVGAYVGYEQMKADHAMTDVVNDTVFTWCSRGPSLNGARGVDIYAPGSAIASFPAYIRERLHLANGTSMSSPNLCGCLALLISAWKQEIGGDDQRISPYRVKNAIMQTAKDFGDELGAGLIQTEDAWQFLKKHAKRTYEDVEYDTVVMDTDGMQGIYLRNAQDSDVIRHMQVKVSPIFPSNPKVKLENDPDGSHGEQQSQTMFDFEQRVILTTNVPWVRIPEALYVGSAGNTFGAIVDATKLEPGHLHIASIDGYDSNNVDRGPIFSVPVTVTKPYAVDASACIRFNELRFSPTDVVRRFVTVPAGATRATIMVNSRNNAAQASAPAMFYLHCLQISPQSRFNTYELKKRIQVGHKSYVAGGGLAEQRSRSTMDVIGNATLEVCVAQFWSQLGSHEVDVFVSFNGIVPAASALSGGQSSAVVVNGNSGIVRTDFAALVCPEYKISPSASLDTLRTSLRPSEASISPVGSERDVHPATGVAIYKLVMDYKLSIKANDTQVHLHMPALDTMIYENWADDFALAIFDVNKRRLSAQISYTKPVTIAKKGDYLVRVQLRHRSPQDLESLKNMPLMVDTKLSASVSLQIKNSLAAAFTSTVRNTSSASTIPRGDHIPLFFKTEAGSLPSDAAPGDILRGTLSLSSTTAPLQLEYVVPTKIPTKPSSDSAGSGSSASDSKDEKESQGDKDLKAIDEALRKVRLEWIKKTKDDSVRDKLVADLVAASTDDSGKATALAAHLESIDIASKNAVPWSEQAKFSKTSAKRAIEIADRLVGLSYSAALTSRLYESQQAKTASAEDKELKQKADKAKDQVVAALRTKCRALAFLATQNTLSCASSEASVEFIDVSDVSDDSDSDSDVAAHVKDYEKAVSQLAQWVSASSQGEDAAYLLATTPLRIAKHHYAQALQPVLKWLSKAPLLTSNAQERKSMTELRDQLLSKLHWTVWTDYFRVLAVAESPASYEAL
ncbi:hypothetical protein LPJ53_003157 [Coemansia erecta]|uniref:Tripeptidyl-peptidase II n=1 Tax=Coemansia erecta TaxID=147472 RepID=A0A9W7XWT6_9FUNG|nr:hypothetical protein LPJ53_003157 [Coemansia erecta]